MFDRIAENINDILSDQPSVSIQICRDFNIHHKEWFVHSDILTDEQGKYWRDFSIAYGLTQILDKPTRVPDITGHCARHLGLFLTSYIDKYSSEALTSLGT